MKKNNLRNILLLAIPMVAIVLILMLTMAFSELEYGLEDALYQKLERIPDNIKIIAIDEATLTDLGPYSNWNRGIFAELVNILYEDPENTPELLGFDIVFTGTNGSEGDKALAEAVERAGNVITASQLEFSSELIRDESGYRIAEVIQNEACAYPELEAVSEHGFTNAILDQDGYIRHAYAVVTDKDRQYYNFSYLVASLAYENHPEAYPHADFDRGKDFELVYTGLPGDFEKIPMSSILSGKVPASYFADSIVLVGAYEEGMMDAYSVPIYHGEKMYGVEVHANTIWALLSGKKAFTAPKWLKILTVIFLCFMYTALIYSKRIRSSVIFLVTFIGGYELLCIGVYRFFQYKFPVLYLPIGFLLMFLTVLIVKYVEMQKKKAEEMEETLLSMADAMAEAIDSRTPYNASHTKNVARRSVEMVDYINAMHKEGKTEMHFSKGDRKQLFLAAMLHDVGKMDIPIEVMDKPTKLGDREKQIKDRLAYIRVLLERDALKGKITDEFLQEEIASMDAFLGKLGLFNCGKPLKPEDFAEADALMPKKYILEDGTEIPYLTKEESDSIHIKAGTLSDEERKTIQSHVIFTDKILSHVKFGSAFDRVRQMASNHHEVLNGKGYPNGLKAEELDTLTRILTIMDIYDALVADDRPYKKAKPIPVAFDILDEEAKFGKVDEALLAIAKEMYLKPVLEAEKKEGQE